MATELKRSDTTDRIAELLGPDASKLLDHPSQTISKEHLQLPGPDFVDRVWAISDRSPRVFRSLQTLFDNGRLAGTGYLSILPVDQGIEHSAGASFAPNPQYFDPENIVKLAIEGGCNAVASTFGVLGTVARKYAHKIPFIVKINHNELLTLSEQVRSGDVWDVRRSAQHRCGCCRRDDLFWIRRIDAADHRSQRSVRLGARARNGVHSLVLPAQSEVQNPGRRHSRGGGSYRPGEPSRRHDPGRHHQAETARAKRRLQSCRTGVGGSTGRPARSFTRS